MTRILLRGVLGSSLLLFTLAATAQTTPEQIPNPFYSNDEYQNTHSMFDKIRSDLYRAQTDAHPNYLGDGPRYNIAHTELRTLEQNWDKGKYDSLELENTTLAVQMVLNDNRLMPYDRDVLSSDLSRLLDFRAEYY